ncbi:MAG: Ig-like domain-containing protein, partial [candidate division KSB1 bacterium]|nr:Ig-like domain-containing protein [candidate division KSB1 bacterium]
KEVHAITSPQHGETYRAIFGKIFDGAGNPLDSLSRQVEFAGNPQPDTTRPRLVKIMPADSSRHVALTAVVEMIFSEMIPSGGSAWPLAVQDSSGNRVPGKGLWKNPFQFQFRPDTLWRSRAPYVVKIFADSVFDWGGNALLDTTGQITFWAINADTLSAISGQLSDAQASATGSIHLTARQVGAGSRPRGGSSSAGASG